MSIAEPAPAAAVDSKENSKAIVEKTTIPEGTKLRVALIDTVRFPTRTAPEISFRRAWWSRSSWMERRSWRREPGCVASVLDARKCSSVKGRATGS